jgi:nitronate monooxygenase
MKPEIMLEKKLPFPSTLPFQLFQAAMAGGITTPQLVAAVCNAGAIGSYATGYQSALQVKGDLDVIEQLTDKPYAVNLFIPQNKIPENREVVQSYKLALNKYRKALHMPEISAEAAIPATPDDFDNLVPLLLSRAPKIVSFTFGNLPPDIIKAFQKKGIYLIGTATSVEEAKILADSGIDAVVAQGIEAGGHRGTFFNDKQNTGMQTKRLVAQIRTQLSNYPIIAAGGIMTGSDIYEVLEQGATAVQLGTAFLTTQESGAAQAYKKSLLSHRGLPDDPTVLTNVFTGKYARSLANQFTKEMRGPIPEYPLAHALSVDLRRESTQQNRTDFASSLFCGQGVCDIRGPCTVVELIKQLCAEYEEARAGTV